MKSASLWKTLLKIVISGVIVALLLHNLSVQTVADAMKAISPLQMGVMVVVYLAIQFICSFKWLLLARAMGLQGAVLPFFRYYLLGMFFGLFLPTGIGGDVGRAVLLARDTGSRWMQAFLSILSERICGLSALLTLTWIGFSWVHPPEWSVFSVTVLTGMLLLTYGFTLCFRWIEHHAWGKTFIKRFVLKQHALDEDAGDVWPGSKMILVGIGLSLLTHAMLIGLQSLILAQLGAPQPYLLVATVAGLATVASMLPVSLSGIGVREGSAVVLLVHWGHVPTDIATVFTLIWLSMMVLATVPGGLLLLKNQVLGPVAKKI